MARIQRHLFQFAHLNMKITKVLLSVVIPFVFGLGAVCASAQSPEPAAIVDLGESKLAQTDVLKAADLSNAIKVVKGNPGFGDVVVLLTDPQCPYCRSLHNTLKNLNNVTIYVMTVNSLGPKSLEINRKVWCSPDRAAAYEMAWNGGARNLAEATCETGVVDTLRAKLLKVDGWRAVPAMFFIGGRALNGEASLSEIKAEIEIGKVAAKK